MSRKAISGIALLLCFSAFAVVTSGAGAAVFTLTSTACTGGTFKNLCYEGENPKKETGKWELEGEQTVEVVQLTAGTFLVPSGSGTTIAIECKKLKQGTKEANVVVQKKPLSENGKTSGTLVFEECSITGPAADVTNCEIPASKETTSLSGELTSETILKLTPKAGETTAFIEIPFSNKGTKTCVLKGTKKVTGFEEIEILKAGTAEETKKGKSKESSGLKFGEETASITGELEEIYPGLKDKVYVSTVA
jgi:hypothetical protein